MITDAVIVNKAMTKKSKQKKTSFMPTVDRKEKKTTKEKNNK